MAKQKNKNADETNVEHSDEIKESAERQHSQAVNPHDPDFENDGTSGAKNPHE